MTKQADRETVETGETRKLENLGLTFEAPQGCENCREFVLQGELDFFNAPHFLRVVSDLLGEDKCDLIFDLTKMSYMSSTGVGAMMSVLKTVQEYAGRIVLVRPALKVREVFSILGFLEFFEIADTRGEALSLLKEGPKSSFPALGVCPICRTRLRLPRPGTFRCPECRTIMRVHRDAGITLQ